MILNFRSFFQNQNHAQLCVYPTRDTSAIETAEVQQEEEADKNNSENYYNYWNKYASSTDNYL